VQDWRDFNFFWKHANKNVIDAERDKRNMQAKLVWEAGIRAQQGKDSAQNIRASAVTELGAGLSANASPVAALHKDDNSGWQEIFHKAFDGEDGFHHEHKWWKHTVTRKVRSTDPHVTKSKAEACTLRALTLTHPNNTHTEIAGTVRDFESTEANVALGVPEDHSSQNRKKYFSKSGLAKHSYWGGKLTREDYQESAELQASLLLQKKRELDELRTRCAPLVASNRLMAEERQVLENGTGDFERVRLFDGRFWADDIGRYHVKVYIRAWSSNMPRVYVRGPLVPAAPSHVIDASRGSLSGQPQNPEVTAAEDGRTTSVSTNSRAKEILGDLADSPSLMALKLQIGRGRGGWRSLRNVRRRRKMDG